VCDRGIATKKNYWNNKYLKGIYKADSSRMLPLTGPKTSEDIVSKSRKDIAGQN